MTAKNPKPKGAKIIPHPTLTKRLKAMEAESQLSALQGIAYLAAGLWPLINIRNWERVSDTHDHRSLARSVGGVIALLGGLFAYEGVRHRPGTAMKALAAASAAGLAAVDLLFLSKKKSSAVHMVDGAVQLALLAGWSYLFFKTSKKPATPV